MEIFARSQEIMAFANYCHYGSFGRFIDFGSQELCGCTIYIHLVLSYKNP
jgi:hypothetical protein